MKLLVALLATATLLSAADITGKWSGSTEVTTSDGQLRTGTILMNLRQNGEDVTGTAGPTADRQPEIRDGKLRGDRLTFTGSDAGGTAEVTLTVKGDQMTGEARFSSDNGTFTFRLQLKRE